MYCIKFRDIGAPQAIASLGVGVVGLGEGKENSRIFGQVRRLNSYKTLINYNEYL